jgi:hypothetical protein
MAIRLSFNGLKPGNGSARAGAGRGTSVGEAVSMRKNKKRRITTTTRMIREGSKNLRGKACLLGEYGFLDGE